MDTRVRGFVLPLVLIVIALLSVLSLGLSQMARNRMLDLQLRKDVWADSRVGQDVIHQNVYAMLVGDYREQEILVSGQMIPLDGRSVIMQGVEVKIQDVAGLFSLAIYSRVKFSQLLKTLTDEQVASRISSELADWVDEDDIRQFRGMEAVNYASKGLPQSPRNKPIRSLEELLELPSMTPDILNGTDQTDGLIDLVVAGGADHFNIATAPDRVVGPVLGLSKGAEIKVLEAKKQKNWVQVLSLIDTSNWVFNDLSPFAHGSRYMFSITGSSGKIIRAQIQLTPYAEDRLFSVIDWRAPYYKSE